MFTKIKKIKNLGIFRDWQWPTNDLGEFRQFNIVYGWNGCGKSTLTRLFQKIETKEFSGDYINVEFEIGSDNGNVISSSDLESNVIKVKVFNQRFLSKNISWDECQTEVIAGIGKDAMTLQKRIEENEKELKKQKETLSAKKIKQQEVETELTKLLRKEAKNIKESIGFKNPDGYYNNFDSPKLQQVCSKYTSSENNELNESELIKHEQIISGALKDEIHFNISFKEIITSEDTENPNNIVGSLGNLRKFLKETVQNKAISRWKSASSWVHQGREIHEMHNEKENCIFCGNNFLDGFWEDIEGHFSSEYEAFLKLCDRAIVDCEDYIINTSFSIQEQLYDDLKSEFQKKLEEIETQKDNINHIVNSIKEAILIKKSNPLGTNAIAIDEEALEAEYSSIKEKFVEIESIISEHNKRCVSFVDEVKKFKGDYCKTLCCAVF